MSIPIPNSYYLETQNTHYDTHSEDPNTCEIRAKYKVCAAILQDFDVYTFFVSTTRESSCPQDFVVTVETQDWIDRVNGHLEKRSYLSANHIDILSDNDILNKRCDPNNGFIFVGKLPDSKYNEMISKYSQCKGELDSWDQETARVAFSNFFPLPEETIQRALNNLGIS